RKRHLLTAPPRQAARARRNMMKPRIANALREIAGSDAARATVASAYNTKPNVAGRNQAVGRADPDNWKVVVVADRWDSGRALQSPAHHCFFGRIVNPRTPVSSMRNSPPRPDSAPRPPVM